MTKYTQTDAMISMKWINQLISSRIYKMSSKQNNLKKKKKSGTKFHGKCSIEILWRYFVEIKCFVFELPTLV